MARALVAAIRDASGTLAFAPGDGPALLDAAATHRVAGTVHRAVVEGRADVPDDIRRQLSAMAMEAATLHLRTMADLRRVREHLDGRGVAWCVVKGPVVAERLHGAAGLRRYVDLDVLVDPAALEDVVAALEEAGASVLDTAWGTLLAWRHTQMHLRLWAGTTLDLHWHLVNEWFDRDAFTLDTATVLARRVRVDVAGLRVPTLDPVDTLVHLCVHAAVVGGQRLGWLRDIHLAAHADGVHPDLLRERTRQSRTTLVVATMLTVAATALDDADLVRTARALSPSRLWTAVTRTATRVSPPARWSAEREVTLGWALCRSTRQSAGRSSVILLRNMPRLLVRRLLPVTVRHRLTPRVERLVARFRRVPLRDGPLPDDGPHRRDAYFAWVRRVTGPGPGRQT